MPQTISWATFVWLGFSVGLFAQISDRSDNKNLEDQYLSILTTINSLEVERLILQQRHGDVRAADAQLHPLRLRLAEILRQDPYIFQRVGQGEGETDSVVMEYNALLSETRVNEAVHTLANKDNTKKRYEDSKRKLDEFVAKHPDLDERVRGQAESKKQRALDRQSREQLSQKGLALRWIEGAIPWAGAGLAVLLAVLLVIGLGLYFLDSPVLCGLVSVCSLMGSLFVYFLTDRTMSAVYLLIFSAVLLKYAEIQTRRNNEARIFKELDGIQDLLKNIRNAQESEPD